MQERLLPPVYDFFPLRRTAAWAHRECDLAVAEADRGLGVLFNDGQKVAPAPEIMALTLNELARCLARLLTQLNLLITYPSELGYRIGASHLRARAPGCDKRHASARRVHRQVDMLDVLERQGDGDLADVDRFCHQYPGWFLTNSNSAMVALRSRLRRGNSADESREPVLKGPGGGKGSPNYGISEGEGLLFRHDVLLAGCAAGLGLA
jgi:hypothetical protein